MLRYVEKDMCTLALLKEIRAFPQTGYATNEGGIPDGWMGLDAGPKTCASFAEAVLASKTILWNG